MRLRLSTRVHGQHQEVIRQFNRSLFERLTPPGAQVDLVRFDGSETGDVVHLRLRLPLMKPQDWISDIVDHGSDESKSWFVDRGTTLPWFLSAWEHHHIVKQVDEHSCEIIDDIRYSGPAWLPDPFLYPVLWMQFAWRKPVYREVFGG